MPANASAAIATSPEARPSSPSVRLTAFDDPVTTSTTNGTNSQPKSIQRNLKNGTWVLVGGSPPGSGHAMSAIAIASPSAIWPASL